jgi:outer membrane protein W
MGKAGAVPPTTAGGVVDTSKDDVSYDFKGMVPLWFDVGYRINPAFYLGGFFEYAFGVVNKDNNPLCNQGISCSAHDITFGINAHYHILPDAQFDPWVGAGLGYEVLTASESGTAFGQQFDGSLAYKGVQFLILEAGGDFKPTPSLGVGPFVNFAVGHFGTWSSSATSNGVSQDQSGDLVDTGTHEWLTIGLRGQYNL